MAITEHPLTGMVLRVRSIVDRPFRPTPQSPGMTQQTFSANRHGQRGKVLVVLVLGAIGEHVEETEADLVRVMAEMGWTPQPDHPLLVAANAATEGSE